MTKNAQINPPFDGTSPCPMCNEDIRGASAYVHNFLTRWPGGKAFVKLNDLRRFGEIPKIVVDEVQHPAVKELCEVIRLLCGACAGMVDEGLQIKWTPEIRRRVEELVPRAERAMYQTQPLTDVHFSDNRHCSGTENFLCERQGSVGIHFLPKYDYHYTVDVVPADEADLIHSTCGAGLKLHQHFKDNLSRDPSFYARVRCPGCSVASPFAQFRLAG